MNFAIKETLSCERLKKILEVILAIGNFMNYSPFKLPISGFKIDFITKIGDTRSNDNKTTALHYLCSFVQKNFPDILKFSEDLRHLDPASKLSCSLIDVELRAIKGGLDRMKQELKHSTEDSKKDNIAGGSVAFHQILNPIYDDFRERTSNLEKEAQAINALGDSLRTYFGLDESTPTLEEILQIVINFAISCEIAHRANQREIEIADKNREVEKKRAANQAIRDAAKAERRAAAEQQGDNEEEGGILDNMQKTLRAGNICRRQAKTLDSSQSST